MSLQNLLADDDTQTDNRLSKPDLPGAPISYDQFIYCNSLKIRFLQIEKKLFSHNVPYRLLFVDTKKILILWRISKSSAPTAPISIPLSHCGKLRIPDAPAVSTHLRFCLT